MGGAELGAGQAGRVAAVGQADGGGLAEPLDPPGELGGVGVDLDGRVLGGVQDGLPVADEVTRGGAGGEVGGGGGLQLAAAVRALVAVNGGKLGDKSGRTRRIGRVSVGLGGPDRCCGTAVPGYADQSVGSLRDRGKRF